MSLNGSGVYSAPASSWNPAVDGTVINATDWIALLADLTTALSTAVYKDGQQTVTANIPMGGFKLTGVGAGTASTDAASLATIQAGTGVYVATVGGTADVITITPSPAITAYAAGQTFRFIASGANTTNVTVNVSALGAKAITKSGAVALVAGDIASGAMVTATYDGTRFQLVPNSVIQVGTWTPTILGSSTAGAQTYSAQSGRFTLIASRLVVLEFRVTMTVKDGATAGNMLIGGLPYTVGVTLSGGSIGMCANVDFSASYTQFGILANGGTTTMFCTQFGDNQALSLLQAAAIQATTDIAGSIMYSF